MNMEIEEVRPIRMDIEEEHGIDIQTEETINIGSTDYDTLNNKPKINGVELQGLLSLDDIGAASSGDIPTKVSELENDTGFITEYTETDPVFLASIAAGITSADITKWNNKSDFSGDYNDLTNKPAIPVVPSKVSAFINDAGYLSTETDPTVPSWAKAPAKPAYTASEVGALPDTTEIPSKTSDLDNDSGFTTKTYVDEQDDDIRGRVFFGQVDSTSTATVFTAQIEGVTEYQDGLAVMLKNGVITSATGFTININGLGAKPVYNNMAAASAETTLFNANYTMLFVYDSTRIEGGAWILYRGYNSDTNTIGYQVRTNSYSLPAKDKFVRYRLLFESADREHFVPANTSTSTNATGKRDTNQTPINPFGLIVYYGATAAVAADARPGAASLWQQYVVTLGYSFNRTGAALTLTSWKPVYLKCAPQADGSAIIDADTPYVQDLPTTNDGKIYIFLGVAYSATAIELNINHPIYYHDGTKIRPYTG